MKLTAIVANSNTCLIFINQIREKIGVIFGSSETTTGGRALKFYSSIRIDIRRIGATPTLMRLLFLFEPWPGNSERFAFHKQRALR